MTSEVTRREEMPLEVRTPNIMEMIHEVVSKGVTSDNANALDKLADLHLKMEAVNAKRQFFSAFSAMQSELPVVIAHKEVLNGDKKTVRYTYAPFEDIVAQIKPIIQKFGFAISFTSRPEAERMVVTCIISHVAGHSQNNECAIRVSSPVGGNSAAQMDSGALTTGKRRALCDALNITIDTDDDARVHGGTITAEQSDDLQKRIKAVGGNPGVYLEMAGVSEFKDIREAKYQVLDQMLTMKERAKRPTPNEPEADALERVLADIGLSPEKGEIIAKQAIQSRQWSPSAIARINAAKAGK